MKDAAKVEPVVNSPFNSTLMNLDVCLGHDLRSRLWDWSSGRIEDSGLVLISGVKSQLAFAGVVCVVAVTGVDVA
ncbi:hypothetical protein C5167_028023 [Papaver somniferum]|nr:hypothetical protein C5167_028023 [Papaver somniferum]